MTTTPPLLLRPWKRKSCKFYLKVLCCVLFLLIYFAIFLQESINATKLKQGALRQHTKRSSAATAGTGDGRNVAIAQITAKQGTTGQGGGGGGGGAKVLPGAPVERSRNDGGGGGVGGANGNRGGNKTVADALLLQPPPRPPSPATKAAVVSPVNSLYEYSDDLNAALEQEFAERNQLLAAECANLQLTNRYPPNAWEFFVSPGHSLAWCPVFKAASSLWLYYFNVLGGYNVDFLQRTRMPPLELARKKFARPTQEELADALATSTSFLIVREPFERLVSAYRNKFEGARNKYFKQLGDWIVKKHRSVENGTAETQNHKGPTFEEFIRYIVNRVKADGVTKINEHWAPIYSFCTPCTINFTLIVKTETLARDSEYISRQALVESLLFEKLPKKSTRLRALSNRSIVDTKTVKLQYFSELSVNMLEELLRIYRPDFLLFGYNSTAYTRLLSRDKNRQTN